MMEDHLWWKTTYDGRRHMMEDDLWCKTTYDGRRPMMEVNLWWKTTYDGRRPKMEDDLWLKTTYDERWPMMEENLWWKTTFDGSKTYDVMKYGVMKYEVMKYDVMKTIPMGGGWLWVKFPFKRFFPTAAVCVARLGDALTTATMWPFFNLSLEHMRCLSCAKCNSFLLIFQALWLSICRAAGFMLRNTNRKFGRKVCHRNII